MDERRRTAGEGEQAVTTARQLWPALALVGAAAILPAPAPAQSPWNVTVTPTMNPLPAGFCGAIHLLVTGPGGDVPRNPQGARVTMADFDIAVTTPDGTSAVAQQIDASHWSACACQSASAGGTATVIATYPAAALPAAARVPGVTVQRTAPFVISAPKGTGNPAGCAAGPSPTFAASPPGTPAGIPPAGTPPASAPPASAAPASAPPATSVGARVSTPASTVGAPTPSAPTMVNPAGFMAVQTAPGQVQLSWQPVSSASYYVLLGPGLPGGGARVSGATTLTASAVPAGTQEWAVASYYEPGPASTPASAFPRVTLNVTAPAIAPAPAVSAPVAASGRYLVTVTGLRAYQASVDDILSRDGMGDEVYAAAYVRRYDRKTGDIVESRMQRSMTYGDITNFGTQRLQAGTKSGTGGIQDGDPIPAGPLAATRRVPAQSSTFPWRLWEGTLTDGADALVITPSLWEQDLTKGLYTLWEQEQQTLNLSLFTSASVQDQITEKRFGALVSGASGIGGGGGLGGQLRMAGDFAMINLGMPLVSLLSTSHDRPIGLVANGTDQAKLPTHAVVLTREIIEAALATPPVGMIPSPVLQSGVAMARIGTIAPTPGILMIQFEDSRMPGILGIPERPAIYQMFVLVERVP
jgi:hypothetical protein